MDFADGSLLHEAGLCREILVCLFRAFHHHRGVALTSNFFLGQSLEVSLIASGFLLLTSLALISLSLGLGAVYAQFDETNPMKISSGYGGIITVVLSLIYVGFSVTALVLVINLHLNHGSEIVIGLIVGFVIVLTILYTWLPLKWGVRAISSYER